MNSNSIEEAVTVVTEDQVRDGDLDDAIFRLQKKLPTARELLLLVHTDDEKPRADGASPPVHILLVLWTQYEHLRDDEEEEKEIEFRIPHDCFDKTTMMLLKVIASSCISLQELSISNSAEGPIPLAFFLAAFSNAGHWNTRGQGLLTLKLTDYFAYGYRFTTFPTQLTTLDINIISLDTEGIVTRDLNHFLTRLPNLESLSLQGDCDSSILWGLYGTNRQLRQLYLGDGVMFSTNARNTANDWEGFAKLLMSLDQLVDLEFHGNANADDMDKVLQAFLRKPVVRCHCPKAKVGYKGFYYLMKHLSEKDCTLDSFHLRFEMCTQDQVDSLMDALSENFEEPKVRIETGEGAKALTTTIDSDGPPHEQSFLTELSILVDNLFEKW